MTIRFLRVAKKLTLGILAVVFVLLFFGAGMALKLAADSRGMSVELGIVGGRLIPCPESPNCVSSDAPLDDGHYVAPLNLPAAASWAGFVENVGTMDGAQLVTSEDGYARFTFTTRLMRFVDDVELHYRPARGEIAVRSASRVGYGDMDVNRNRVEAIRTIAREATAR